MGTLAWWQTPSCPTRLLRHGIVSPACSRPWWVWRPVPRAPTPRLKKARGGWKMPHVGWGRGEAERVRARVVAGVYHLAARAPKSPAYALARGV